MATTGSQSTISVIGRDIGMAMAIVRGYPSQPYLNTSGRRRAWIMRLRRLRSNIEALDGQIVKDDVWCCVGWTITIPQENVEALLKLLKRFKAFANITVDGVKKEG